MPDVRAAQAEVVVAEDDPDDRFLILRALRRIRPALRIAEVRDGIELIEYLAAHADGALPRLVLLDLNMPRMSGREALSAIRGDRLLCELPVAVLSTSVEPEDMRKVGELGVAAFASKPDGFASLVKLLGALLDEHVGRLPGAED